MGHRGTLRARDAGGRGRPGGGVGTTPPRRDAPVGHHPRL